MQEFKDTKDEEIYYLEQTIEFLRKEVNKGDAELQNQREKIVQSRRDMWENTAHFSTDFERMTEVNQHLVDVESQSKGYVNSRRLIEKYRKAIESPYFGRFDFVEEGYFNKEKIYIGLCSIMDEDGLNIFVYDWRTPIAGIFYQYEAGKAKYNSTEGEFEGEVLLKRQYKIENSKLKFFFDSNVRIGDEILQEVLSKNASKSMRNIVETIQKDQDRIIRDVENELLMVQGVAGSGKTSIALHRIAFLLYQGKDSHIGSNNIIIISPNNVFSKYISNVLPELGEDNVNQITMDDILGEFLGERFIIEKRREQLEKIILIEKYNQSLISESVEFKGSREFVKILDRFISYYERKLIPVEDVYFNGEIIQGKNEIKNSILNNKINMPLAKRLKKLENRLVEKIHPLRRNRISKIEKIVEGSGNGHDLEIKSFSRLLSIKEAGRFMTNIRRFTSVDYFKLYTMLFNNQDLILKLSKGVELPKRINDILNKTKRDLSSGQLGYEDALALLYLKIKLEGSELFQNIKYVVIDEAQDYYPIHYGIFRGIFDKVNYTVLGDINQSIERKVDGCLYDNVNEILNMKKSVKLTLNKSYRSSYEISEFAARILNIEEGYIPFHRHESEPLMIKNNSMEDMNISIVEAVKKLSGEGMETIAVICKSQQEAEGVYNSLKNRIEIKLLNSDVDELKKNMPYIIPSYMAKGLEFDAVIIYQASKDNYFSEQDKNLLYIGCTRALHRLLLTYTGEASAFIS